MKYYHLLAILILAHFVSLIGQEALADDGDHESEKQLVEESIDSMYSAKEANISKDSPSLSLDKMFSPTDLFTEDELVSPDPMPMVEMKVEGSHNENVEHHEIQVQLSHHELVATSSKGFGVAAGITVFVGIVFAGLTYFRSGEE